MSASRKVLMLLGSYDPSAHRGIARGARECGWHLDVSLLKTFQLPKRWRGDGIITSLNRSERLVHFIRQAELPTVDLSIWRSDLRYPRVVADNEAIGRLAADHLAGYGHRRFAWFALSRNPVGEARLKGYRTALPEGVALMRLDGNGAQRSEIVARRLREGGFPVAVFCKSDDDAAWLQNCCLEAGFRIPDEVAILGVDNNELICLNQPVPLSSVNHDLERIGYEGAIRLELLMEGGALPEPLFVEPDGVSTRQSTDSLAVSDPKVREALAYLVARLRHPLGTEEIAGAVGLSRRMLEIRFKRQLRISVHGKLLELRLKEAARRLSETGESVEDIAAWTGFANAPHLSRTFKARFGMPPLRYRKASVEAGRQPLWPSL